MYRNRLNFLRNVVAIAICLAATTLFSGCDKDPDPIDTGTEQEANIVTFTFAGIDGTATIDKTAHTVTAKAKETTDLTAVKAEFTLSKNATAKVGSTAQVSGQTANNFTNPVTYRVTSGDGETTQDWTVTITKEGGTSGGTWKLVENPAFGDNATVLGVAYGGSKFVAVGTNSKMAYSTDGTNWTAVANTGFTELSNLGKLYDIMDIAYGNGKFVAVGLGNQMAYSTDGINWTAIANTGFRPSMSNSGYSRTEIMSITYGNGKFIAGGRVFAELQDPNGEHGAAMAYSTDGINWTAVDATALGYGGNAYSTDYNSTVNSIVYDNGKFVAVGFGKIAHSTDGINWTEATNNIFSISGVPQHIYGIAYGAGKYVAGGALHKLAYSANAANWTEITGTANPFVSNQNGIRQITYANGKFIATDINGRMAYSTDGLNWTTIDLYNQLSGKFGKANDAIYGIAYGTGKFVAVGRIYDASGNKPFIAYCND